MLEIFGLASLWIALIFLMLLTMRGYFSPPKKKVVEGAPVVPPPAKSTGGGLAKAGLIIGLGGGLLCLVDVSLVGFPGLLSLFIAAVGGMLWIVGCCLK